MTELEKQQAKLIKEQAEEIRLLREKVDLLVRKLFGQKSEQLDPAQLELLLDPEKAKKPEETAGDDEPAVEDLAVIDLKKAKRKERKARLPEHLPVEERVLDPAPVKANPDAYRCIGEEVSEQLDYTPGRFTRKRLIRRKYVHRSRSSEPPIIAPLPAGLQDGTASPARTSSLKSSSINTPTICPFTASSSSSNKGTQSTSPARA